jgi:uncharacterized protein YjiK/2',3'-cyclic-nucleotide 2'-phosphodiesterase (5'-nucleotidase family)
VKTAQRKSTFQLITSEYFFVGISLHITNTQEITMPVNDIDLSKYIRIGRYDLPEPTRTTAPTNSLLAQEVSAVTYNKDTDTLFVLGDGGTSIVQVSKTGALINSMTLAPGTSPQGTTFYDPEGLAYIGGGKFVFVEERDRIVNLFTYTPNTTLTRADVQGVKLGTTIGNIGIEGITYDPQTGGFIAVKEITPKGIFQTNIDFVASTATNGSPTTVNSIDLFDPAKLTELTDFADVFALSNITDLNGKPDSSHLLVLSQETGKIVEVDRAGNIFGTLTIVSDPGNPLSIADQQHEGLAVDKDGILYVVSENGGGSIANPQLWVYAPSATGNTAPTALTLNNKITSILENTSTTTPIKVADIVVTDDGLGTNTLSLTGADASFFEITGNVLSIKAGTKLDFETKTSYSINVNVDDTTVGSTPDVTTAYTLAVTDIVNETPTTAGGIFVTEVAPWSSGNSPVAADWFELTNTGTSAVNITGWKFDDNSNSFASAVTLNGITSIGAGESVVFLETTAANTATVPAAFLSNWFGTKPPSGIQVGTYTGSGVGLSTAGDAVNIYNAAGDLQTNLVFGASPSVSPFATFNNAALLNNATTATLSAVGINGAFSVTNTLGTTFVTEIGSPGRIKELPAYTLQLLSYYGESGLLGVETAPIMGALIDKFDDQYSNTLVLGEGDSYIPGPWLVGGSDPSLDKIPGIGTTALGRPDIAIMNAFGTNASALGNHEFDLGSPVLAGAIAASGTGATAYPGALFPFVTSNLNFAADSALRGLADASLGGTATNDFAGKEASVIKGKIAPYTVVTKGGEKIGIVGATTYDLLSKTSPNGTVPKDDGIPTTDDLQEVAAYIQTAVDALRTAGVNKIVMVDQLDTIERNKALAPLVSGIDVMVAGGGHERLGDATDKAVGFNGHSADFVDTFPIVTAGKDGKTTLIITTDTEYTYLGRLVVDFNANGEIIVPNLNPNINGAYASTEANLQAAYGSTGTAKQIVASSTIGSQVSAITSAINNVIISKDSNIFGYTKVYLEGDRAFGRAQEVNFGDISADANIFKAQAALGGGAVLASLKNGGGLRASVGSIGENGEKLPPAATGVKPVGGISQLDIENALRFDNKLMVFDTTPQGLLNILNYAAGLAPGNGGFAQVGGVQFSYDLTKPDGQKVQDIAITDLNGNLVAQVADNGVLLATAPAKISVVTLNFIANGGDGYPIKTNADNFRYLLDNGTLSAPIDKSLDFTAAASLPANALGEQKAFQDFLQAFHGTPQKAYNVADTPATQDQRIQNLQVKASDTVFSSLNQAPTGITFSNRVTSIAENTSTVSRTKVADIGITDDGKGTNILSLSGADAGSFELEGASLFLKANTVLNFEAKNSFALNVNVNDPAVGLTPDITTSFGLTVIDVNEAPTAVVISNAVTSIAENTSTASRTKVADLAITDDALGTNTLSLSGADAASFELEGNALFLKANTVLNFEAKNSFALTVNVNDPTVGLTPDATVNFGLTVTDVNEAPTAVVISNAVTSVAENSSTTSRIKVADLAITDDALGTNTLSLSGADAGSFELEGNALFLKANTVLNFEAKNSFGLTVNVNDPTVGLTPDATINFGLTVTDVNEAPTAVVISNAVTSIAENTSTASRIKVADLAITDDALGTNTLSLSGADAGSFELDGNALFLKANTVLNFEAKNSFALTVNVNDPTVGITPDATVNFGLSVTNVNEPPSAVVFNNAVFTIAENASTIARTKVADVAVTDDALGTNVLSLSGSDASSFELDGATLYLKAGVALNFDVKNSLSVVVNTDDATVGVTPDASKTFTLKVANANSMVGGTTGADRLDAGITPGFGGISDIVFTGAGNDIVDSFIGGALASNNRIDTGSGNDMIFIADADRVFGSAGDDELDATDAKDYRASGGAGNDIFYLGTNGKALGGDGNDQFYAGSGGGNTISGGAGVDQFWIANGEAPKAANTILDFQIGTDLIYVQGIGANATNLVLTQAVADTSIAFGGQTLAILKGIQASSLTPSNPGQFVFS